MLGHNGNVEEGEELHDLVSFPFVAGRKKKDKAKGGKVKAKGEGRRTVERDGATDCLSHLGTAVRFREGWCLHTPVSLLSTCTHM